MVCNDAARRLCDGSAAARIVGLIFFLGYVSITLLQLYNREDIGSYWYQPLKHYLFWLGTAGVYTVILFVSYSLVPFFRGQYPESYMAGAADRFYSDAA
jgi:hypothetical protein